MFWPFPSQYGVPSGKQWLQQAVQPRPQGYRSGLVGPVLVGFQASLHKMVV
jgi:hypothetical protein